jgi:hypothetical protein
MKTDNKALKRISYYCDIINIRSLLQALLIGFGGVLFNLFMLFAAAINLEKRYSDIMTKLLFYPFYASVAFYLFCLISKKKIKFSYLAMVTISVLILVTLLIDGYIYCCTMTNQ